MSSDNENSKSTRNTKSREMPKAARPAGLGWGLVLSNPVGACPPSGAGHTEMWTEATRCRGIQGFHAQREATPWTNDPVPATAADEPEAGPPDPPATGLCRPSHLHFHEGRSQERTLGTRGLRHRGARVSEHQVPTGRVRAIWGAGISRASLDPQRGRSL